MFSPFAGFAADLNEEGGHPVAEQEAVGQGAEEALLLHLRRRHAQAAREDVRIRHGRHGRLGHVLLLHAQPGARGRRHPLAAQQRLAVGTGGRVAPVRGGLGGRRDAHDGGQHPGRVRRGHGALFGRNGESRSIKSRQKNVLEKNERRRAGNQLWCG